MNLEETLRQRIEESFLPTYLELDNESHQHSVPANSETHFRAVIVSGAFADLRPVARHQKVYALTGDLMAGPLHALALHLYTPDEWAAQDAAPESPACLGGSKAEQGSEV